MTTPSYNGTYNADDPLVAPWYLRGWTSQAIPQDTVQATPGSFNAPPFPSNLVFVQVTGNYFDMDSNGLPGFLTLKMSDNITVNDGGVYYRMPSRYAGRDNSAGAWGFNNWGNGKIYIRRGQMSVTLFATDNSFLTTDSGQPLTYFVEEHFMGGQTYSITVPEATVSPADIHTLIVAGTVGQYNYDPVNPLGYGS